MSDEKTALELSREIAKMGYIVRTAVVGTDEQGRTLVRCPNCGESSHVEEDGRVVCPTAEAWSAYLSRAMENLRRGLDTPTRPT